MTNLKPKLSCENKLLTHDIPTAREFKQKAISNIQVVHKGQVENISKVF